MKRWHYLAVVGFLILIVLVSNFTDAYRERTALERSRLEQERQLQEGKMRQDRLLQEKQLELEEMKARNEYSLKSSADQRADEAACQEQIEGLRKRFRNIEGGGYDPVIGCAVTYRDKDGNIQRGPASGMVSVQE